jgi:hypothetical protein
MTKYTVASQRRAGRQQQATPAIWRGIGCLLILVVPFISYVLAAATVQLAVDKQWPMPYQLMGYPVMPNLLWKVPGFVPVLAFIQAQRNLYAVLTVTVVYVVALGTLISLVYSIIYRLVGPSRYGPLDVPPPSIKVKRYKR